ncbi:MAG: hypothetical protein DCF27_03685 [Lysobacteraceae bacterium]|nr:MAG: hypothetical protein DCF27_03685 [Xanthomonadaceae bacterium]
MSRVARAIAVVALVLPAVGTAQQCTPIPSLPAVISQSGSYCLGRSHVVAIGNGANVAAIQIDANDVTLDCRGNTIDGRLPENAVSRSSGISATSRKNIIVRNCSVRGFRNGVSFTQNQLIAFTNTGLVVEDNRFDGSQVLGIGVSGDNSVVRRNIVTNIGGSGQQFAGGIATGHQTDVVDNLIDGVTSSGDYVFGINQAGASGSVVSGNHVRNLASAGSAYGIAVYYSEYRTSLEIRDNVISNLAPGPDSTAIVCGSNGSHIAIGNLATGYARVIGDYCVDGGGNRGGTD